MVRKSQTGNDWAEEAFKKVHTDTGETHAVCTQDEQMSTMSALSLVTLCGKPTGGGQLATTSESTFKIKEEVTRQQTETKVTDTTWQLLNCDIVGFYWERHTLCTHFAQVTQTEFDPLHIYSSGKNCTVRKRLKRSRILLIKDVLKKR